MALGEAFTILAVLEATDRMSSVLERVDGSLGQFSETATRAATAATEAGARIDESLLQTASGADALRLADARVSGAQARVAETAKAQADAERALLEAQSQLAAAENGDAAAATRLTAAFGELTAAQKRSALAAKEAAAAGSHQADVSRAAYLSTTEGRAAADAAAASQARLVEQQRLAAKGADIASKAMKYGALAVAAIGYESVKSAGNFESMTEHLVTDAGESQQNIGMIRSGMLALATATGTTTDQMAAGMYHVESAGFHGQKALDVLKVAAEGAKVGGADLDTIGQALTGTMNAFGTSGGTATQMMNAMIATVGAGDMKMEAFGSSLGNVAAIGASAHLSFAQVAGAVATMTAQNVTAQRATMDLAHTIGSLGNPTAVMNKEMTAVGINSLKLSSNLGKNGLTGTFDILVKAIAAHTKGGAVMVNTLNASKAAAAQANTVLGQMPPTMKKMAAGWQAGTTSTKDFNTAIQALPPAQQKMYLQFEQLTKKSSSFATALQANTPMAQTFNAALAKMTGGTTSLNTILMLSGQHAETFKDNVATIAAAAHKSGSEVDNWSAIQGTFNQKMAVAKASVEAAGISLGTVLLPAVSSIAGIIAGVIGPMATWISQHQKWAGLILSVAGGALLAAGAMKAWRIATEAWSTIQKVVIAQMALFDAEADANPIGLIVIAIAALVAGLIYAYTHFKTFRDIVNAVFSALRVTGMAVVSALTVAWHALATAAVWVGHALETTWNAVVSAAMTVWHSLEAAWNAVSSVTMTVWNAISGFFQKWWPLLLVIFALPIAILLGVWNHFHEAAFAGAKATWNAISGFFVSVWNFITKAAKVAWDLFAKYVLGPIQLIWTEMQGPIHAVEHFLATTWSGIKATASVVWSGIKTAIINPVEDVWHTVSSTFDKVKSAITSKLDAAWNAVKNIGSKFLSIGKAIVDGIVQGVTGAGGSLFSSLQNLASGALNAAKSFLGIGSPSKEFASQVGQWIPHGIAAGVVQYASVAQRAVASLSNSLTGTAHASVTGGVSLAGAGPSMAYAGGGGGANLAVTIDLRGAVVSNQQAMNQLADQVGKSITQQLARAGVHIRG
ncbi:phage tail tape measure protein [Streptacidiphilus sp. PAMC 29251]